MRHLQLLAFEQSMFHNFDGNNYVHTKLDYSLYSPKHWSRFPKQRVRLARSQKVMAGLGVGVLALA